MLGCVEGGGSLRGSPPVESREAGWKGGKAGELCGAQVLPLSTQAGLAWQDWEGGKNG